jgi:hypothetical protein
MAKLFAGAILLLVPIIWWWLSPSNSPRIVEKQGLSAVENRYNDERAKARADYDAGKTNLPTYQGQLQVIETKKIEESRIEKDPFSGGCRMDDISAGVNRTLDIGTGCLNGATFHVWRGDRAKVKVETLTPAGYAMNMGVEFSTGRPTDIAKHLGGEFWEFEGDVFFLHKAQGEHYILKVTRQ